MFTLQSIAEELRDRVNFEVVAIDNWCQEVEKQLRKPDRGHNHLYELEKGIPWLKVVRYKDKLSHWQAKNVGVLKSSGKILFFCDAHCLISRDALFNMFETYSNYYKELNGTLHLPLTYHIMEYRRLIYRLKTNLKNGAVHYSFCSYADAPDPYEVPCMSTCGMMITRELYDLIGGWPKQLGIYGGGENFLNFSLAVIGKKKWIMPGPPLRHHGDKRGYNWNSNDYDRNRTIATFIFGGRHMASRFVENATRGGQRMRYAMLKEVAESCEAQRQLIKSMQVVTIEDWVRRWEEKQTGKGVRDGY